MEELEARRVSVQVQKVVLHPDQPPKAAHRFFYAVVGNEIQLEVGFLDLGTVFMAIQATAAGSKPEESPTLFVTDRFVLSPEAALDLYRNADRLVKHLRKAGHLPAEEENNGDATLLPS